jgi:hypothetical protein
LRAAVPVLPLPVAMVQASFRAPLVSAVGRTPLPLSCLIPTGDAAVALSPVAMRTEKERRKAVPEQANPLPENCSPSAAMRHRKAALDIGSRSVAPWNQLAVVT